MRETDIAPPQTCEACGLEVAPDEAVQAEMTFGEAAMCPTPMSFHPQCFERAGDVWFESGDSLCSVDPEYPETGRWLDQPQSR
ncbi:MAG TPA: hypothetical protein VM287_00020 [Egibacteraceae bacterium]|nr:hypothetical protein [Egibacteraceae bacterium]